MFKNKIVIITGSTQGIGFKTAELLAKKGAKLVINSRSPKKLETALENLLKLTPNVIGIAGNVSDYEFCIKLRNFTISHFGKIDILINNAGVASSGLLCEMTPRAYNYVFNSNISGSVYPTLACIKDIKAQQGSVLFISSVAGIIGLPNYSAYSASKRAIVSLAESFKNEWFDDNVFVGINYPGFTENDEKKTIVNSQGDEVLLAKRDGVKVNSLEKTASKIIHQLEAKQFRVYSSINAKIVQYLYSFFPKLCLFILRINRNKIINMQ